MTATYTIDSIAKGMFSFQIHGKWAARADLLRVALDIPLEHESGVRASFLAETRVRIFNATLKLFGVDETGMFRDPEKFNEAGFRRTYYNEFQKFINCSKRTIARGIAAMKKAGFLDAYQEVNTDGTMGDWWIRLNPWALLEWLEKLAEKRRLKKGSPCARSGRPLSSLSKQSEVAVATQQSDSDSAKKGIASPMGNDSKSSEQTPGFPDFAKEEILKSETGKVLPELTKAIPEFENVNPKQLMKLHKLVHHFVPTLRCNEEMVKTLSTTMEYNPDLLEGFQKIGIANRGDKLGVVDTFLKFWPGIAKKLWEVRLSKHDQDCYDDRYTIDELEENLFAKAKPKDLDSVRKQDPGSYWVRCLALALTHKWTAAVVAVLAKQARGYLMRRPVSYATIYKQFPQIVRLCQITEKQHKKLMAEVLTIKTRLNVWSEIQATYGFEYILTPVQRRRKGGVLTPDETDGGGDETEGHAA